jgi:hypothetical protein
LKQNFICSPYLKFKFLFPDTFCIYFAS